MDPNPLHTQGLLHASVSQQLKQLQENLNVLTLDVACFFGGSYYFLCPDIIKEKNVKKKTQNEIQQDVEQSDIEGRRNPIQIIADVC